MDDINQIIDPKKLRPKRVPFRCVNCNGYGTVQYGKKICHSCNGKGFIVIDQEIKEEDNE